jgi:signal transduction histidine kinase/ligand-binding sensor domain-containing protein
MLRDVPRLAGVLVAAMQITGAASGQDPAPLQYTLSSWTESDGLPATAIRAIAQDHDGYLWLGTRAGLVRFDGVQFVIWEDDSDAALTESDVTALYAARDGSLWIGYGGSGGISRLKDGRVDVYRPSDGVRQGYVQAIFEDRDGVIWAGGPGGLSRFFDGRWEPVGLRHGIADESILSLHEDYGGNLWIGFTGGAFVRKAGARTFERVAGTGPIESVGGFSEDASGVLWIADRRGAIATLASPGGKSESGSRSMRGISSRVIHDAQGNLWIAQRGNGVFQVPRGRSATDFRSVRHFTVQQGLAGDDVSTLLEDPEGNIWVATDGGLTRLSPAMVASLSELGAENGGMAITPDGSIWIANDTRIARFSNGHRTWYAQADGLPGTRITAVHTDRSGTLWAAGTGGLASFDGRRFRWVRFPGVDAPRAIQAMADHPDAGLWLSANGQRFRWHKGGISRMADPPDLAGKLTWALYTAPDGAVWEGFADGTLAIHRGDSIRVYSTEHGLASGSVNAILQDRRGAVWVGTSTGLSRFRDGRFASLPLRTLLPRNMVVAIVEDEAGYLWLGVSSGIVRLHPTEFEKALHAGHQVQYTFYGSSDGLRGFPYRRVYPTGMRGGDGVLRFITSIGVSLVDPRRAAGRPPIGVRIEQVHVDDRPLAAAEPRLPARTSRLEIAYRALSLTDAENIQFRHRLEGFDRDWVKAGTARQASYSNLRPGQYRFRVVAGRGDGVWSDAPAAWEFSLEPSFYQTRWFYASSAAGMLLFVFGAWQLRQRQIQRQFALVIEERARMAREIHDTLLQSLVGLTLQLDALATQSETAPALVRQLTRIRRQVERYIRETRQSIWHLRAPMLETRDLVTALREAGESLTARGDVRLEYTVTGTPARLAPRVDEQLLRIGQEAISNAVRHSQSSVVRVVLEFGPAAVRLRVQDEGRGFDRASGAANPEQHLGLTSMVERAFRIGARLEIVSRPGAGATVEVTAPLASRKEAHG